MGSGPPPSPLLQSRHVLRVRLHSPAAQPPTQGESMWVRKRARRRVVRMVGSHGKPRRKPEPGTVSLHGVRLHEEGVRQHELTEDLKSFLYFKRKNFKMHLEICSSQSVFRFFKFNNFFVKLFCFSYFFFNFINFFNCIWDWNWNLNWNLSLQSLH